MSGCDLISKYIVHILKPGASKIHKTHFMSDLSSLFPFLMSRIYILFVTYLLHNISRLQFRVKNKISPLDKQSLIVFLQTFNFIYSFIVVPRSCLHHTLHQTNTRMAVAVPICQGGNSHRQCRTWFSAHSIPYIIWHFSVKICHISGYPNPHPHAPAV